jgi:hypothetical protein
MNEDPDVTRLVDGLDHPLKDEIAAVRAAILAADGSITEHVKWKAPSFCDGGDDRVTFRIAPAPVFQLVFHRGTKVRDDAFAFTDDSGLLEWRAADRALLTLRDADDVQAKLPAVVDLVQRWMLATRE